MGSGSKIKSIKACIWIYFWLLIFEGALRRWIFPGIQQPLLLVRDPVIIWTYLLAIRAGVFPGGRIIRSIALLGMASFLASWFVPDSDLFVTLYGLRANFLHLPLIFLIPRVFTEEDVRKIGRWVLLISIPMALLMVMQFSSPRDSFLNRGIGSDWDQLPSALGYGRAPGTFSFVTGPTMFFSLALAFILYGIFKRKTYNMFLILLSGICFIVAGSVSGSRSFIFFALIVFLTPVIMLIPRPQLSARFLRFIIILLIVGSVASSSAIFKKGKTVLTERFIAGGGIQSGIIGRIQDTFRSTVQLGSSGDYALLGSGIGTGTNVGSVLITGHKGKTWIENEWDRHIIEGGLLLGLLYIILRIAIVLFLFKHSYDSLYVYNILPMLLFGVCAPIILMGQFGQPGILGFAVLVGGLCLAAANIPAKSKITGVRQ